MADWKLVFVFDSNINIIALKLKLSQLKLKMQLAATTNCISKNVSVSSGFAFSPVARVLTYQHLLNDVWLLCDNAILIITKKITYNLQTIRAAILGLSKQISEIPAQRKFVSAECHAHSTDLMLE